MSGSPEGRRVDGSQSNVSSSDAVGVPPSLVDDISWAIIKVLLPDSLSTVRIDFQGSGVGEVEEMALACEWLPDLTQFQLCSGLPELPPASAHCLGTPWLNSLQVYSEFGHCKSALGFLRSVHKDWRELTCSKRKPEGYRMLCLMCPDTDLWVVSFFLLIGAGRFQLLELTHGS